METLGSVVGVLVVIAIVVLAVRRRANMTPQERQTEDMQRDIRSLKREERKRRFD